MTPHEAAKSTDGRKRLAGWLKGIENAKAQSEPGSPIANHDASWMWEELGMSDLRR